MAVLKKNYLTPGKTIAAIREYGEACVEVAKAELKKGVDEVLADAKNRCPVLTGKLRDSIKAEPNKDGSFYRVKADAFTESPKSPSGKYYYGIAVEFSPKINKPYMYPALDAHRQEIYENISNALSRMARQV